MPSHHPECEGRSSVAETAEKHSSQLWLSSPEPGPECLSFLVQESRGIPALVLSPFQGCCWMRSGMLNEEGSRLGMGPRKRSCGGGHRDEELSRSHVLRRRIQNWSLGAAMVGVVSAMLGCQGVGGR